MPLLVTSTQTRTRALASAVPVIVKVAVLTLTAVAGLVTVGAFGAVLSTVKVVLGPAAGAVLPAVSLAVPAAIEIPSVPSPVIPERVTVRVVVPLPDTATVAPAVPVAFNEISANASVTKLALPYVTV